MTARVETLMKTLGLSENVLNSLERGDSLFVLTDQTLLYQDSGGTRRVTLRDLKRIHSDQDGLLRVETPAGTALTANLLGFDPAAVQGFFSQVRDATGRAKQQGQATSTAPAAPPPAPAPQPQAPSAATSFTPAPTPPAPSRTVVSPDLAAAARANPGAPSAAGAAQPPSAPTPRPGAGGGLGLSSTQPTSSSPSLTPPAFKPQEGQPEPAPASKATVPKAAVPKAAVPNTAVPNTAVPKATVRAVRNPTVITDPAVSPSTDAQPVVVQPADPPAENIRPAPLPVDEPALRPAKTNGSAVGTLASLAAVAGAVSGWAGALKAMSLIMLLATFGMAYFQYDKGQGIGGFWTLIAGGMGAVALWVLSDLVKLLVTLAQAVSAEGGVMDVD